MNSFYSTRDRSPEVSLKTALLNGLAEDGGLYLPSELPELSKSFFEQLPKLTLPEIASLLSQHLLGDVLSKSQWETLAQDAFPFDAPLVQLNETLYTLELFHGPTLSFKDFGARFMARLIGQLIEQDAQPLHVLAATSGDTGSAVASGFLDVPGIRVWLLYPKGRVSPLQEKQLTSNGRNITALAVRGSFDDCQAIVKQAFSDKSLREAMRLTSANSINIGRLIPQMFYYFYAVAKLGEAPDFLSVPCGNFGNITAALMAKKLGLPLGRLIAATNRNDSVPRYLRTGQYAPHPTRHTLSNAMDVGNPSNFERLHALCDYNVNVMRDNIFGFAFSDEETLQAMIELYHKFRYMADPHGAVAYLGIKEEPGVRIFLETAHPGKFASTVERATGERITLPKALLDVQEKDSMAISLPSDFPAFRDLLLQSRY